jgi:hypothetical protein
MQDSKRSIALSAVFAALIYFVPNLVQDFHLAFGNHEVQQQLFNQTGLQFQNQSSKCPVCIFEFYFVDQLKNTIYNPFLKSEPFLFTSKQKDQIQNATFHYYNLRAPPSA